MASNQKGSVLMEAVLVLPLYITLLGGLFVVGDVLLARLRLSAVERTIAWGAGIRYLGNPMREKLLEMMSEEQLPAGSGKYDTAVEDGRRIENRWLEFVWGSAKARVEVPFWIGMANTSQIMDPDNGEPLLFEESMEFFNGAQFGRSYVVRRKQPPNAPSRDAPPADLQFTQILSDWHLFGPPTTTLAPFSIPDYQRNPRFLPLCE